MRRALHQLWSFLKLCVPLTWGPCLKGWQSPFNMRVGKFPLTWMLKAGFELTEMIKKQCDDDNSISVNAMTSVVESHHKSSHIRNVAQKSLQNGTMLTLVIMEYTPWINGNYHLWSLEKKHKSIICIWSGKTCRWLFDTSSFSLRIHTSGIQTIIDSYSRWFHPCAKVHAGNLWICLCLCVTFMFAGRVWY